MAAASGMRATGSRRAKKGLEPQGGATYSPEVAARRCPPLVLGSAIPRRPQAAIDDPPDAMDRIDATPETSNRYELWPMNPSPDEPVDVDES